MKNKPILLCFGTRPEWLKIKPLIKIMDRSEYKLLFTGQHTDLLKDVEVDYKITISENSNRLDSIISDCMLQFPNGDFKGVLVQGDTGSAFGCALAAFNRKLRIYYLEAGLRSGNANGSAHSSLSATVEETAGGGVSEYRFVERQGPLTKQKVEGQRQQLQADVSGQLPHTARWR